MFRRCACELKIPNCVIDCVMDCAPLLRGITYERVSARCNLLVVQISRLGKKWSRNYKASDIAENFGQDRSETQSSDVGIGA
jgi:hypothetical protein